MTTATRKAPKYWWTFAGDDTSVTFHRHTSRDAMMLHYSRMRTIGGAMKRIGHSNRQVTQADAEAGWNAAEPHVQCSFID